MIVPVLLDFKRRLQYVMLLFSSALPVFDVKTTLLEAMKALTKQYLLTNSSFTIIGQNNSMSLSNQFLHIKEEN